MRVHRDQPTPTVRVGRARSPREGEPSANNRRTAQLAHARHARMQRAATARDANPPDSEGGRATQNANRSAPRAEGPDANTQRPARHARARIQRVATARDANPQGQDKATKSCGASAHDSAPPKHNINTMRCARPRRLATTHAKPTRCTCTALRGTMHGQYANQGRAAKTHAHDRQQRDCNTSKHSYGSTDGGIQTRARTQDREQ